MKLGRSLLKVATKNLLVVLVGCAAMLFVGSQVTLANTLITLDGGKPKAGLAKSWKKVKEGQYEFELDTAAELKPGTKVTTTFVKDSLEAKLGGPYSAKVTADSPSKVTVTFKGDEAKFLEQVSKTKIRAGKDVQLAMESSVSDGGIRAKAADRPAADGEVKAIAIKVEGNKITGKVNETKSSKLPANEKFVVKGTIKGLKQNDKFFFKPEKKEGDAWVPVAGSLQ